MQPFILPPNKLHRFYEGGARIDALRGDPPGPGHHPEDWVGSTATSLGSDEEGLARLADGALLRDLIAAEPEQFLGAEHVARWGANPAVLIKLLDAGERLPVHYHPGRAFAREHLDLPFGKTESWLILEADEGAAVHVGLRDEIEAEMVRRWVVEQDADEMLAALRRIEVKPGDAVFVPAGTMHAIGEGILLLELQEPTDLSVLVEHEGFAADGSEHLFLGWELALQSVDLTPGTQTAGPELPPESHPYFRAPRVKAGDELEPSFAVLLVMSGEGTLRTERGEELPLTRGRTALVPFAAGTTTLDGDLEAIRCLPPDPHTEEGRW